MVPRIPYIVLSQHPDEDTSINETVDVIHLGDDPAITINELPDSKNPDYAEAL